MPLPQGPSLPPLPTLARRKNSTEQGNSSLETHQTPSVSTRVPAPPAAPPCLSCTPAVLCSLTLPPGRNQGQRGCAAGRRGTQLLPKMGSISLGTRLCPVRAVSMFSAVPHPGQGPSVLKGSVAAARAPVLKMLEVSWPSGSCQSPRKFRVLEKTPCPQETQLVS